MSSNNEKYICETCGKKFKSKQYLQIHLNREIACNKTFPCKKCGKIFPTPSKLRTHENRKTSCVPEVVPVISDDNEENMCHICGKTYSSASNLRRHQKTCDINTNLMHVVKLLVEQNKQQNATIQTLIQNSKIISSTNDNSTTNIDNSTTNIQNNNMYVNVTLCCFGQEDLTKLDQNKVLDMVRNHEKDFIPKMIEHVHANPDMPEYHNVFFDPESGKAIVFVPVSGKEKSWEPRDFSTVSAELTKKMRDCIHPRTGPYFNIVCQAKDSETANAIIRIADHTNWNTPEVLEQNQTVLSKVQNNRGFSELVEI